MESQPYILALSLRGNGAISLHSLNLPRFFICFITLKMLHGMNAGEKDVVLVHCGDCDKRQEKDGHDAMNATMKNGANSDS